MGVIERNITRTILDLAGSPVEVSQKTNSLADDPVLLPLLTTSSFYLGFKKRFTTRHFDFLVPNTTPTSISVEFWDGLAWVTVLDVIDQTNGFTQSGFLSWINDAGWKKQTIAPIDDRELYYVRLKVSVDIDAGTSLQSVLNLFCDEDLLRDHYPELVSDSRYLPPGRTSLVGQLKAGKDKVVTRLLQDHIITDESQIIDINPMALAAVHATAEVILTPIARDSEGDLQIMVNARDAKNDELNRIKFPFDVDDSGVIEKDEELIGNVFIAR